MSDQEITALVEFNRRGKISFYLNVILKEKSKELEMRNNCAG
jgi:hypothetical protein